MKHEIATEVLNITPAMAEYWLEHCNNSNRALRMAIANKYARDMEEGRWDITHQGIAFYSDGTIADGQHRLMAITIADRPVQMMVTRGLSKSAVQAIDQNAPRQMFDVVRLAGGPEWASGNAVAIVRSVLSGMGSNPKAGPTAHEVNEFITKHHDALKFIVDLTPRRRRYLTTSYLSASYFCALMAGESKEKISRFAEIMWSGEINGPQENAAIRLREYLLNHKAPWSGSTRVDTSRRAQKAIKVFCREEPLSRLYAPDSLLYPQVF